jgi:hypothetical protein
MVFTIIVVSFLVGVAFSYTMFKQVEIRYQDRYIYVNQTVCPQQEQNETKPPAEIKYDLLVDLESGSTFITRGGEVNILGSVKDQAFNPVGPATVILVFRSPRGTVLSNTTVSTTYNGTFQYRVIVPVTAEELGAYSLSAQAYTANRWSYPKNMTIHVTA